MKLRLTKRAERDYDSIEAYTVENHGIYRWLVYSGLIEQGFSTLRRFPTIGIVDRELPRGHQAFKVSHHWICYEINHDIIEVKAIIRQLGHYKKPPA